MKPYSLLSIVLLILILLFSGCAPATLQPFNDTLPEVSIQEIRFESFADPLIVNIDNCYGKTDRITNVSHAFTITVEGITDETYSSRAKTELENQYAEFKNKQMSQVYKAAPGTDMEFRLYRNYEKRTGTVKIGDETGTYTVEVPLSINQVAVRDSGCEGAAPATLTPTPTGSSTAALKGPAPTAATPTPAATTPTLSTTTGTVQPPASVPQTGLVTLGDCFLIKVQQNCVGLVRRDGKQLNLTLILKFDKLQKSYDLMLAGEPGKYPCTMVEGTSNRYYCPGLPDKTGKLVVLQIFRAGSNEELAEGNFAFNAYRITKPTPIPPTPTAYGGGH